MIRLSSLSGIEKLRCVFLYLRFQLSPVYTTQSTPPAINVIDDRRLWRSALLVACVFTLGDVARKWLGVTMRRSVVAGTRPWLLRRNMLGAWMVDANFIFILVSISSYVSFSLACIRLFHPRLCMVFVYFSTYFHHVHPSYRPLILFSLFLHPEFGLTML